MRNRGAMGVVQKVFEGNKAAGGQRLCDMIFWDVAPRTQVSRERVRAVVRAVDQDLMPDLSSATALSRVVGEVGKRPGLAVRPFEIPNSDTTLSYGVYVIHGRKGETGDQYDCGARVRITPKDEILALPPEKGPAIPEAMTLAQELAESAVWRRTNATSRDVSGTIVSLASKLGACAIRNRGGIYLLPLPKCETWASLIPGFQTFGVEAHRIEMNDTPTNVRAAAASVQSAMEEDIAKLLADLEKANESIGSSKRGRPWDLQGRMAECTELAARAALYRNVLFGIADQIAAKCEKVKGSYRNLMNGFHVSEASLDALKAPLAGDSGEERPSGVQSTTPLAAPVDTKPRGAFGLKIVVEDDEDE